MKEENFVMKGENVYKKENCFDTESNLSEKSIPIGKPINRDHFYH